MKRFLNKYIVGSFILGASSLALTSCDLDEYNPSGETAEMVFVTPQGMESLVNQMYYNFRWKYYGREDPALYMEGAADIWQNSGDKLQYGFQLTRCVDLQGDRGQIANAWNRVYDNINVCNAVINRIGDVNGLKDEARNSFEGEARFMRSYCYWWLVEFFGDIEMRVNETGEPIFSADRTPREKIYDEVIIPDARRAAELLPVTEYNGDKGRSTRKAAKGLLARVLLTRASYEAEGSAEAQKFYEEALAAAKDVIDNKSSLGIKLYQTYDEIWQAKNNKTNTEFLWVTSNSSISSLNANPNNPNRLHLYWSPKLIDLAGITNGWEYPKESTLLMPTYYFMKLWQDWDQRYDVLFQEEFKAVRRWKWTTGEGRKFKLDELNNRWTNIGETVLKFTKNVVTDAEIEEIKDNDNIHYAIVGINQLYDVDNVNSYGGARLRNSETDPSITTYMMSSFPRFKKYRYWDGDENGTILLKDPAGVVGYADVPVMRYAEMPLIAAECLIRLGRQAEAATLINQEIRNARVVKEGHSLTEAQVAAGDMTIEWIMEERARELCGEWLRWFDCKRVYAKFDKNATNAGRGYAEDGSFAKIIMGRNPASKPEWDVMKEYHAQRPIPNTFLDKLQNAEEFGQNRGYNPYERKSE